MKLKLQPNFWRFRSKQLRRLFSGLLVLSVAIAAIAIQQPAIGFWNQPQGDSVIYGKLADTHLWKGVPGEDLVKNAKVTINTLPPQTTRTDEHGNFWFKKLPDADYLLKVKLPYDKKEYSFRTQVHGKTGTFLDVAMDEEHNLEEIDY
ncbi:carboxypeptidase-like regulatory domain-containing protein [Nostoc sp. CCY0012]|uniref:carboxypeptidase-like regulatory domain-containing protein n=1 Tax=Nostoc sp. CCY0012 TaxID=1056123 RepID=UPI0039C74FAC